MGNQMLHSARRAEALGYRYEARHPKGTRRAGAMQTLVAHNILYDLIVAGFSPAVGKNRNNNIV
jgi:hypothetical protein